MRDVDLCFVYCSPIDSESSTFAALPVARMARACSNAPISFHAVYSGELDSSKLEEVNVATHHFDSPPINNIVGRYFWLYQMVNEISKKEEIDVFSNVWAHYDMLPVIAASGPADVALRVVGDPLEEQQTASGIRRFRRRIGRILEKTAFKYSDCAYFNSNILYDRFLERAPVPSTNMVVSQGVDLDKFSPSDMLVPNPVFVFAGRLNSEKKGIERTIDSFEKYVHRNSNANAKLYLAGRGTVKPELRQKIERIEGAEIRGYLPHEELVKLYQRATALLLLSETESLPNVVLEGMASGLPVIATDVGDIPELLAPNRGIVIEEDGTGPVVQAMETLTNRPEYRQKIADNALSYVEANHSFTVVEESFVELFCHDMGKRI